MLASLLLLTVTGVNTPIFVGRFEPTDFPNAQRVERRMPHAAMDKKVEEILAGECRLPGQTKTKYNITVPYAVLLDEGGRAKKVVVKDLNCPAIEKLVGQIGRQMAAEGDFKVRHDVGDRWYVSDVYFARLSEEMAREEKDLDKVICKGERPKINSRVAMVKTCRTVAEWNMYDKDRDQYRRDFMSQDPRSGSQ